jgi:hypothetical protein
MPFDAGSTKRGLLEELIKLAREARANGLKDKLSPKPEAAMGPSMGEGDDEALPADEAKDGAVDLAVVAPVGDDEKDEASPEVLKKLLELMGG